MPRAARIVIPHVPHHVTQRGNNRQDVFFTDDDRRAYLELLRDHCEAAGVRIVAYCLMTNHVHLILVPPSEDALSRAIGRTHFLYTRYVNRLHGRCGHLWQGRFYSSPLDDEHLWRAAVYIERNPVRARLVRQAWRWPWSSAAAHIAGAPAARGAGKQAAKAKGQGAAGGNRSRSTRASVSRAASQTAADLLDWRLWQAEWTPDQWRKQLGEATDDTWRRRFWRAAHTGRPLADDAWLAKLESRLGRRLRANPVGRPKKAKAKSRAVKIRRKKR